MQSILLVRYPACTRLPPIPVLAAARNAPEKTIAGTVYKPIYSGGSVGPIS